MLDRADSKTGFAMLDFGNNFRDRETFLADLNYLNMVEIKTFCARHSIPFRIEIEVQPGVWRKSKELDRKGIILRRIRQYLEKGKALPPTRFAAKVVSSKPLPARLTKGQRLHYGQYSGKNQKLKQALSKLTSDRFRDGATARILLNEFWRKGEAPTLQQFAQAWTSAEDNRKPRSEWAFLADRSAGRDTSNWKALRNRKAKEVLRILNQVPVPSR